MEKGRWRDDKTKTTSSLSIYTLKYNTKELSAVTLDIVCKILVTWD